MPSRRIALTIEKVRHGYILDKENIGKNAF